MGVQQGDGITGATGPGVASWGHKQERPQAWQGPRGPVSQQRPSPTARPTPASGMGAGVCRGGPSGVTGAQASRA